jgi:hypothetical protein
MCPCLTAPRRWLAAALCGAALVLASVVPAVMPARAAEANRAAPTPPPEPIVRHYDDVNYIARHASREQQIEVRRAVLRAPGSKPPPHLREIGERIARVEAAVIEPDPAIAGRSVPPLNGYAPTHLVAVTGAAPLLRVRVRVTDALGRPREEVHVWEESSRGWMRRAGAYMQLTR